MTSARRWTLALGTSVAALATASASPAWAQCVPDPTIANVTTECSGTDADGLRVTTHNSTVHVASSSRIVGAGGAAILVDIDWASIVDSPRLATIIIDGQVDGGTSSGIFMLSGTWPAQGYDFYGTEANITVAAGATVAGSVGITTQSSIGMLSCTEK
jgi:hypothetical protein